MKRASLFIAAAIILIANFLTLVHVANNRSGNPSVEITLTNRELRHLVHSQGDEDSGVELMLQWTDPNSGWSAAQGEDLPKWLDRQKLQTLGFDCSFKPESTGAATFYQRQRPRQVFVALEYDGPAWKSWSEAERRLAPQVQLSPRPAISVTDRLNESHLVAIDADLDDTKLRERHPERTSVLILPAAIRITLDPFWFPGMKADASRPPRIIGRIQQIPASITVPRPFSDEFRRPRPTHSAEGETNAVEYRVRLRYGSELEPWVTGVEFTKGL